VQLGAAVFGVSRTVPSAESPIRFLQAERTRSGGDAPIFAQTRPDVVFHLAARPNAGHGRRTGAPAIESNLNQHCGRASAAPTAARRASS